MANLCCGGQVAVDVVDLLLESLIQHLVGFVEDQHLDAAGPEGPGQSADFKVHVGDAPILCY